MFYLDSPEFLAGLPLEPSSDQYRVALKLSIGVLLQENYSAFQLIFHLSRKSRIQLASATVDLMPKNT